MKINQNLENLVYIYILVSPTAKADEVYRSWKINKIFKDYNRPPLDLLDKWFKEIYLELLEGRKTNAKNI